MATNRRPARLALIAVIVALSLRGVVGYYDRPNTDTPYRAIARYVDERAEPGDSILFVHKATRDAVTHIEFGFDAYSTRSDLARVTRPPAVYQRAPEEAARELTAAMRTRQRIWLLVTTPEWDDLFDRSISQCARATCQRFDAIRVCLCATR